MNLIDLILGPLGAFGTAAVAALAWLLDRRRQRSKGRSEGRSEAQTEAMQDANKRVEKGRKHVLDNRGDSPADRLRRNDGKL